MLKAENYQVAQINSSKNLVVIGWKDTMAFANDLMTAHSTRHLPVVDDGGFIVGMISDRDAKKAMIFDQADWVSGKTPQPDFDPNALARDYMSWPVVTVEVTSSLKNAAKLLLENRISALVVIKYEAAVGIITTDDILNAVVSDADTTAEFKDSIEAAIYRSPLGALAQTLANAGI